MLWVWAVALGLVYAQGKPIDETANDIQLRMPAVQPQKPDTYLCHSMKLGDDALYLTGFEPHGKSMIAHHILLYGCEEPGAETSVWNCGEMASKNTEYEQADVCKTGTKILYAWAMDAPQLTLPKDVGFKVGGDTPIRYLVVQVHYKNVTPFLPPDNKKDHSGLTLHTTTKPQPKEAGVYLMGTGGEIPAHSTVFMETACLYHEEMPMHPFAFRTHAHALGQVVSGYRVRDGVWTEIGRQSPQKPQMFYNVTTPGITIQPGDILAARCTMKNDMDKEIDIGSTQKDEMCNFYIMFFADGDVPKEDSCWSSGPPTWSWQNFDSDIELENMPKNVSTNPVNNEVFHATKMRVKQAQSDVDQLRQEMEERFMELLHDINVDSNNNDLKEAPYRDYEYGPGYQGYIEKGPGYSKVHQEWEKEY